MILQGEPLVSMKHFPLNFRLVLSGVIAQHFIQEKASFLHRLQTKYKKQRDSKLKMEGNSRSRHILKALVSSLNIFYRPALALFQNIVQQ